MNQQYQKKQQVLDRSGNVVAVYENHKKVWMEGWNFVDRRGEVAWSPEFNIGTCRVVAVK